MADDVHALLLEVYLLAVKREDALFVLSVVHLHGFYAGNVALYVAALVIARPRPRRLLDVFCAYGDNDFIFGRYSPSVFFLFNIIEL